MIVVGNHDAEESVMVEVASRLVPYVSLDVVSLTEVTEVKDVVEGRTVVCDDSDSDEVTFGGNATVVGKLEVSVPVSTDDDEFPGTVCVGTIEPVEVKAAEPDGT